MIAPSPHGASRGASVGDRLVYAIGDIHGRLDLFLGLLDGIMADCIAAKPIHRPLLIPLGDYVDRGPNSSGVLSVLADLRADPSFEVRPLRGNHEQAMLTFLRDAAVGPTWARFGGAATLTSYGVFAPQPQDPLAAWEAARSQLQTALPAEHLALLQATECLVSVEDYIFVHAGVRPGFSIEEQSVQDVLWIRHEFLGHGKWLGKRVVHGHSAQSAPQVLSWRVGIDTGAYATGALTALRLFGEHQSLMQARVATGATTAN
jgi:serine/threonine protein phosphatase 1